MSHERKTHLSIMSHQIDRHDRQSVNSDRHARQTSLSIMSDQIDTDMIDSLSIIDRHARQTVYHVCLLYSPSLSLCVFHLM